MYFFKNGVGWLVRHNKVLKPQASRRSQAPIFRQQAANIKRAGAIKPFKSSSHKPQATVYRIIPKL
tara:strand:- start:2465 stop:2662 length:198 start_codon:yes stop_codon:yes gene_type:complete